MEDLLLPARLVVRTTKFQLVVWFGRLREKVAPKSVPHVQHDYFFPHSTNQINDFWRCHYHFLNFLLALPLPLPLLLHPLHLLIILLLLLCHFHFC